MKKPEPSRGKTLLTSSQKAANATAALRKKVEEMTAGMQKEEGARQALARVPAAIIVRARELKAKGKFIRKATERTPENLAWDKVALDCGHMVSILAVQDLPSTDCRECVEAWMLRQAKREAKAERSNGKK